LFQPEDESFACPANRAVVSYPFWQREMGGRELTSDSKIFGHRSISHFESQKWIHKSEFFIRSDRLISEYQNQPSTRRQLISVLPNST
jgi:hypothetical protein